MAAFASRSMDKYSASAGHPQAAVSPAAERNKQPILEAMQRFLKSDAKAEVLEVASGSGQHVAHFAAAYPNTVWQPSDATTELIGSIGAHCTGLPNVLLPALLLDCTQAGWQLPPAPAPAAASAGAAGQQQQQPSEPAAAGQTSTAAGAAAEALGQATAASGGRGSGAVAFGARGLDAMVCINMTHISPYAATLGLLQGAGRHLKPSSGLLFLYGPFKRHGQHTSDSNAQFDQSLQARCAEWGYRDVESQVLPAARSQGLSLLEVVDMPANNFMLVFQKGA